MLEHAATASKSKVIYLSPALFAREMALALKLFRSSQPRLRGKLYRLLSKFLLDWGRHLKEGSQAGLPAAVGVAEFAWQDAARQDEIGYLARAFLRMATYYNVYPGGSPTALLQRLSALAASGSVQTFYSLEELYADLIAIHGPLQHCSEVEFDRRAELP